MNVLDIVRVIGGLVLLVGGGEALVRGASALATRLGLSPLVVGLTVVSVATSAPELAVTLGAVLRGEPEIAVGNVVGSNIANVLLVLGITAAVGSVLVKRDMLRFDLPFLAGLSILVLVFSVDGRVGPVEGTLLLVLFVGHMAWSVWRGRRAGHDGADLNGAAQDGAAQDGAAQDGAAQDAPDPDTSGPRPSALVAALLVAAGVGLLVLGANFLVDGATAIATAFGVSQLVIGLTVVAVGTSLPELAASVIAVRRGERDIAFGNVVGSNIANIGLVLGLPSLLSGGIGVPESAVAFDIPVMVAVALLLLPVAFTGSLIHRSEGFLFAGFYVAYTVYVLLLATDHDALRGFTITMVAYVLPMFGILLAGHVLLDLWDRRHPAPSPPEAHHDRSRPGAPPG
ncbi:calcium/sodium antiporter [Propioniciclava soli]|uniref:Calcium/sodium antiporter n=1 Tax=Propioniciclava soli TaxID=2775081 RepID=A0ABZ3C2G0_9ACTN